MSRRSLRPQLNQIRGWVRQGRTDAWIAHQLEVTVQQIQAFKREHGLEPDGDAAGGDGAAAEEVDLRASDDEAKAGEEAARKAAEAEEAEAHAEPADERSEPAPPRARTRARPRGRGRKRTGPLEGTFDHGEEGYGLWLDPAVEDDPVYAEHWAGHRPVEVTIEEDQIVIRRAGGDEDDDD